MSRSSASAMYAISRVPTRASTTAEPTSRLRTGAARGGGAAGGASVTVARGGLVDRLAVATRAVVGAQPLTRVATASSDKIMPSWRARIRASGRLQGIVNLFLFGADCGDIGALGQCAWRG